MSDFKFIEYPKINTIFNRDDKYKIITDSYSKPEYDLIHLWSIEEKINGTNIRIHFDGENVFFGAKNDNSEIPKHLLAYLKDVFTIEKFKEKFNESSSVTIFGEGYGHKIQEPMGSAYAGKDVRFCLFDVMIDNLWLERSNCEGIADIFGVKMPHIITKSITINEIVNFVKIDGVHRLSELARLNDKEIIFECVIARTDPILLDRSGDRVMWKLKVRDFK